MGGFCICGGSVGGDIIETWDVVADEVILSVKKFGFLILSAKDRSEPGPNGRERKVFGYELGNDGLMRGFNGMKGALIG